MKSSEFKKKMLDLNKKNVVITGHMGSGKSLVGKIIAKNFILKHIDSDKEIIDCENKTINQIFKEYGEEYFRKVETRIILSLIEKKNIVLSLGGGSILNESIRKKLNKNSLTVFLDTKLYELEKRLAYSTKRPLLKNVNIKKKIKELDRVRRKYYLLSNIKIKNNITPSDAFKSFIKKFDNFYEKTNSN